MRQQILKALVIAAATVGLLVIGAGAMAAASGDPVRDGKFEFTVTKVECGISQLGSEPVTVNAQGQFCKVSVTVKNIGDRAQTFDASSQRAFNANGERYSADGSASIYLEGNGNAFLKEVNPGNSVDGTLVFDIPKNAKIAKLELHDSPFSGGVTVNVG